MRKHLYRSSSIRAAVLAGALLLGSAGAAQASVLPAALTQTVSSAKCATSGATSGSTSTYVSLAGTKVLNYAVPIISTAGWTIVLPVGVTLPPQFQFDGIDFTVIASLRVGGFELYYLDVDPRMV